MEGIAKGAVVSTALGFRRVEELVPGTLVVTRDDGLQAVTDIVALADQPAGAPTPMRLETGVLGCQGGLHLGADQHVLLRHMLVGALFGHSEALIRVRYLRNDLQVVPANGGAIYRIHLAGRFLIAANGVWLASHGPGDLPLPELRHDAACVAGECGLFVRRPGDRRVTRGVPVHEVLDAAE